MDQQRWQDAETILRKLVTANPKDARAWFDLGYVMHAEKKYPEAILAYRGAVAAQPESFECNLNLGLMLAHENNPQASDYLETATRLNPTGEHPQDSLARAWAALAAVEAAGDAEARAGFLAACGCAGARECAAPPWVRRGAGKIWGSGGSGAGTSQGERS